jgi:hypothetical protein
MGGNALRQTPTRRHMRDEYFIKENEVLDIINKKTSFLPYAIPAYKTKESFGDMDIVYTHPYGPMGVDLIQDLFNPNEIVKNGSVISFDYKELQVDLIYSPPEEISYAEAYFSFNDLGNFIGRLAKKFGLKHGHNGLFLPVKDGDYGIAEILVTRNYTDTLNFLGLSVEQFDDGFDTLEDIFTYVSSSPVFNPSIYLFENVNAVSRIRDKRRKSYNELLKWCDQNNSTLPKNPPIEKWVGMEEVFLFFGENIRKQYKDALASVAFNRAVKEKFNGTLVSDLTQLFHEDLGRMMIKLKNHTFFKPENLFTSKQDDINSMIIKVSEECVLLQ